MEATIRVRQRGTVTLPVGLKVNFFICIRGCTLLAYGLQLTQVSPRSDSSSQARLHGENTRTF